MIFRTKDELDDYLADKGREVKERLWFELVEDKGMKDMGEVVRLINLEVEREIRRVLEVAEIARPLEKPRQTKLADL